MGAMVEHPTWVTIDTPGVPSGGRYGDPRGFAKRGARHGFYLAWDTTWDRFFMYTRSRDRKLIPQWPFSRNGGLDPQPIRDEHLTVFLTLRKRFPRTERIMQSLGQWKKQQDDEQREAVRQDYERISKDVMRKVHLKMRTKTPHTSVLMPGFSGSN